MIDQSLVERIALALERIAPPAAAPVVEGASAYVWDGKLNVIADFRPLPIDRLTGIDAQRDAVLANGRRLAVGHAAHDILLWGARGSGKSAIVKSSVAALQSEGAALTLIEVPANLIADLPQIFALVANWPSAVIVFVDDLAFSQLDQTARTLRSALEGGAAARPSHVRLYVTSNRRHIVSRDMAEQDSAINPRDVIDDSLALADRFGLTLGFHACDQQTYLAMVANYARALGLEFSEQDALTWATQRGARSGRIAWHYANELAGRAGKPI